MSDAYTSARKDIMPRMQNSKMPFRICTLVFSVLNAEEEEDVVVMSFIYILLNLFALLIHYKL